MELEVLLSLCVFCILSSPSLDFPMQTFCRESQLQQSSTALPFHFVQATFSCQCRMLPEQNIYMSIVHWGIQQDNFYL